MKTKISIFWFRRDLRLKDNVGLCHALSSKFPVLPIFIFDKSILDPLENKKVKEYFLRHTEMEEVYKNLKAEEMEKEVEIDG